MKLINTYNPLLFILAFAFILVSCKRNENSQPGGNNGSDEPIPVGSYPVQGSVQGKIVDENNQGVASATVRCGNDITTTDTRGLFKFRSLQLDKYASVITVEKSGYFRAIRSFTSKDKASNYIRVKLVPKQFAGSIDAAVGGFVYLPNGSSIAIAPNSVVTKSGNTAYSGSITVFAAYIDPTNDDIAQTVPGSFQAVDSQSKRVVLKSYGMMAVELTTIGGETLQVASGKTAKLRISIPSAVEASSPLSVPLWSMNESTGLWEQEGNAVKTDNYYEGDVEHFSYWNADFGYDGVFVGITLKSESGPIPNAVVKITSETSGLYAYGNTDSAGYINGLLPRNEPLQLEVLNNCRQAVFTKKIGPFSKNIDLDPITVTTSLNFGVHVSGTVVNCDNQPLAHGSVAIYYEDQLYYAPVTNGSFALLLASCPVSSNLEIVPIDSIGAQESDPSVFAVVNGNVNTGTLTACGASIYGTMSYTFDGVTYQLSTANGDTLEAYTGLSLGGNGTGFEGIIGIKKGDQNTHLVFEYNGNISIGTFEIVNFSLNSFQNFSFVDPFNVNITAWRDVGQFIEGNLNVRLYQSGVYYPLTATFRVKRFD